MKQLTEAELTALTNCMAIAAEKFEQNAAELRKFVGETTDEGLKQTYTRLAEQFDRQRTEAMELMKVFEDMPITAIANCPKCLACEEHAGYDCTDRRLLALFPDSR